MNRDSVEECATAGVCERQKEQEGIICGGKEKVREFDERKKNLDIKKTVRVSTYRLRNVL